MEQVQIRGQDRHLDAEEPGPQRPALQVDKNLSGQRVSELEEAAVGAGHAGVAAEHHDVVGSSTYPVLQRDLGIDSTRPSWRASPQARSFTVCDVSTSTAPESGGEAG